jgi:transposase InsO family protein
MMSPFTGRRYPLTMVCEVYRRARSSVYAWRERGLASEEVHHRKRGPRTRWTDAEILSGIRQILAVSPFHGEGHRKVRVRLRPLGMRVGKNRVLRIMRENGLLAPTRRRANHGDRAHGGRIRTDRPNEIWGADATRFYTRRNGWCWFFGAIDHCTQDIVGWHVAKRGDRWAALEPIRQGVRKHYAEYTPKIALGLSLRHDWGPQYTAHQFLGELRWLGIGSTPSYVGEPECNGIMERWIRTLKEECLYLHDFESLEQARKVIGEFIRRYNAGWLLERHGYQTPSAARESYLQEAA